MSDLGNPFGNAPNPFGTPQTQGGGDLSAIPVDPEQRILRVPIPLDVNGVPCYPREWLRPEKRATLKAAHEAKVHQNLLDRAAILERCEKDLDFREEILALCAKDAVFWINHFAWMIDPREGESAPVLPFVMFESQEREARFYQDVFLKAGSMLWLDEKSRAWGWTWLHCAALPLHSWLFRENYSCLLGSAKAKDVDNGGLGATHQSLFGKIRFILNRLPEWMLPRGPHGTILKDKNRNKQFQLKHPEKENVIDGAQYDANWGRGPRYTETKSDEAAWSLNFAAAAVAFGQVSNLNHVGSTPQGLGNEYANMRFDAEAGHTVHTLWWAENPYLDTDVYWNWRKKYGRERTAQERDIDYGGSAPMRILQEFDPVTQIITERAEVRDADGKVLIEARAALDYDPDLPLVVCVDPGSDDPFAIVWVQPDRARKTYNAVDFVQYVGKHGPFFIPFLLGYIPDTTHDGRPWPYEYDAEEKEIIDRHRKWRAPDEIFADKYGGSEATKIATGHTIYEIWEEYGVPGAVEVKIPPNGKDESIQRLVASVPRWRFAGRLLRMRTQSRKNPTLPECFQQYSWVQRESETGREMKRQPRHDQFCHAMDAIQFFLRWEDVVDPSVTPLAPPDLQRGRREGDDPRREDHFRRGGHALGDVGEYPVEDDGIS